MNFELVIETVVKYLSKHDLLAETYIQFLIIICYQFICEILLLNSTTYNSDCSWYLFLLMWL